MNQAMNATDAQLLFMHIDTDRNGTINLAELLPVLFGKASVRQLRLMHRVIRSLNSKSVQRQARGITTDDVRNLFHMYSHHEPMLPVVKLEAALGALGFHKQALDLAMVEVEVGYQDHGLKSTKQPKHGEVP